jgi:hypothetical protein
MSEITEKKMEAGVSFFKIKQALDKRKTGLV